MRRLDIAGERYGHLIAISRIDGLTQSRWRLKCDCGNETTALLSNVRSGQIRSCGCTGSRNTIGERSTKHGHSVGFQKSRTAAAWRNAKTRCFNKGNAKYPAYGGRGITMCKEWADDFRDFLRDMGECPDGLTLERVDVNRGYEPGNCTWIAKPLQAKNRRNSVKINGMAATDYATSVGIPYRALLYRMSRGDSAEEAARWLQAKTLRSLRSKKPHLPD